MKYLLNIFIIITYVNLTAQENSCSVYEDRPFKCGSYNCILVSDTIKGNISLQEAQQIVQTTKEQISWLLSSIPQILNTTISKDDINLRDSLFTIYELFSDKIKIDKNLSSLENQFCFHAFDYLKGITKYFHELSLFMKYNNLVLQIKN